MIWHILLAVWLSVPVLGTLGISIASMIKEERYRVSEHYGEFLAMFALLLLWPLLGSIALYDFRKKRQARLAEVTECIEAHYRNQWYE
jgi:hypothetical protein